MPYITTSDLSARLGTTLYARLTDRVDGESASSTVAQQIVDEAEAEADSYLAARYATPVNLSTHPELADVLAQRVLDLAEYIAWRGSPFVSDIPGRVRTLYSEVRKWFAGVVAGTTALPASSPPASRVAADNSPRYTAEDRKFTADELDGL